MTIEIKFKGGSEPMTPQEDQAVLAKEQLDKLAGDEEFAGVMNGPAWCGCPCHFAASDPIADGKAPHARACCVKQEAR